MNGHNPEQADQEVPNIPNPGGDIRIKPEVADEIVAETAEAAETMSVETMVSFVHKFQEKYPHAQDWWNDEVATKSDAEIESILFNNDWTSFLLKGSVLSFFETIDEVKAAGLRMLILTGAIHASPEIIELIEKKAGMKEWFTGKLLSITSKVFPELMPLERAVQMGTLATGKGREIAKQVRGKVGAEEPRHTVNETYDDEQAVMSEDQARP